MVWGCADLTTSFCCCRGQLSDDVYDRRDVRWRPWQVGELVGSQPELSCVLGKRWLARDQGAVVRRQANRPEVIVVFSGRDLLANLHLAQELLPDLAKQGAD